jgi:hypothetical protein
MSLPRRLTRRRSSCRRSTWTSRMVGALARSSSLEKKWISIFFEMPISQCSDPKTPACTLRQSQL